MTPGAYAAGAQRALPPPFAPEVRLADGVVEGIKMRGQSKNVRVFRGIPYAAPPVGEFRFREPQPVARWAGVLKARQFGPRCMQAPVAGAAKPEFRSKEMSEDCLYLNVWTPAANAEAKLPVLVYFHGGGFVSGDGSEPRYDGANMASRGVIAVTVNYRLGVFGFLAPADAAKESPNGTTGNYGLLDQVAALRWVRENIAQFGGDPSQVTIAGNSAGSVAVSTHMISPVSRGLFARAIGESGGAFAPNRLWTREQAVEAAAQFSTRVGAASLQQLRSLPARTLLMASTQLKFAPGSPIYWPHVDGYFLPASPEQVFAGGGQAQVPLLVGSNAQEQPFTALLGQAAPTPERWREVVQTHFKDHAEEVLAHYPGNDTEEVKHAAAALAGDLFVSHSTWRWMDHHRQTGQSPVFYYRYTQPLPVELKASSEPAQADQPAPGATHNAQVAYALGNLDHLRHYAWTAADYDVSRMFSRYVEQFVKTGNPNGATSGDAAATEDGASATAAGAVPNWPAVRADNRGMSQLVIGENTHASWDRSAPRQGLVQRLVESGHLNDFALPIPR
jgi:para-nitrobenzyl esterase